jgi:hypothetical protein
MTELERHLIEALKRLESNYMKRDQAFATTLDDLAKRLSDGAESMKMFSKQLAVFSQRLEQLQSVLKKK